MPLLNVSNLHLNITLVLINNIVICLMIGYFILIVFIVVIIHSVNLSLQYFGGYGYHGMSFEQKYRCYPASFIDKVKYLPCDMLI